MLATNTIKLNQKMLDAHDEPSCVKTFKGGLIAANMAYCNFRNCDPLTIVGKNGSIF